MEKIQIINPTTAYKYNEHKQLIDKINELVRAYNEMLTHEHINPNLIGPINGSYDQFQEK